MSNHKAGKISFASVFLFGINSMVGSGIFLLPGVLFQEAGNWSLILILLAALAVLAMTYCYAEMAHHFSGNGAGWYYTYKEFGRFWGCLSCWGSFISIWIILTWPPAPQSEILIMHLC